MPLSSKAALARQVRTDRFRGAGGAVAHMQLVDDGLYVLPCCEIGDVLSTSDFAIAQAFAHQLEHIDLTLAEMDHALVRFYSHLSFRRVSAADGTEVSAPGSKTLISTLLMS